MSQMTLAVWADSNVQHGVTALLRQSVYKPRWLTKM
jgi:hypothetical protein